MISNTQLELIYNTINDTVFLLQIEDESRFKFISVNESFSRKTGLSYNTIINRYVDEIIPAESLSLVLSKYQEAIKNRSSVTWEEVSVYPTGRKTGLVTVTPVFDDLGKCVRIVGSVHDITDQRLQEEKLKSMNDEREKVIADLIKRNQDLEHFTYIVSHNLRSPVANLMGLSKLIDHENPNPEDKDEIIHAITLSVNKLDTIINDLNWILQIREQNVEKKEMVFFRNLVDDICISIKDVIQKHAVSITLDCHELDGIYSVKSYVYSIFYNLIINSIKYRKSDISPAITIVCKNAGDIAEFVFSDNGKGLDMKKNGPYLFGLYKRFDTSVEGKGLGLYLLKNQIESLKGSIVAKSEPGDGMMFIIKLPMIKV
ncbi:MAG: PAS domain-containing sensor histidine kinase [Mucilaginibacter sp.]